MQSNTQKNRRQIAVVTQRHIHPFVGWVAIDEFEDLLVDYLMARLIPAKARRWLPPVAAQVRRRLASDFYFDADVGSGDLLIVVARSPGDLAAIRGISNLRARFEKVVGVVIDAYFYDGYPRDVDEYDHLFVTTPESAEYITNRFGSDVTVLPQGCDALRWSSVSASRSIDIVGFGRLPKSYHRALVERFHSENSPQLYLHSPIGNSRGLAIWEERPMLHKLLQRTKVALAFHLMVEPTNSRPVAMFLTNRWFECLSAGCVVAGKRPVGSHVDELLFWENATLELSDDPVVAVEELLATLSMPDERLQLDRERNVSMIRKHHDWRHRISKILDTLGLPHPERLERDVSRLMEPLHLS